MKIIDLINKIAMDEEVPEKIKWHDRVWKRDFEGAYYYYDEDNGNLLMETIEDTTWLNQEVEIIENKNIEDENIEKFKDYIPIGLTSVGADFSKKDVFEALLKIGDKINEIINHLNKEGK